MWTEIKRPVRPTSYNGGTVVPSGIIAQAPLPPSPVVWPPIKSKVGLFAYVIEMEAAGVPLTERERVQAALVAAGLSLPAPSTPADGQLSPAQREELARRVSVGAPLSQIIIEERRGN